MMGPGYFWSFSLVDIYRELRSGAKMTVVVVVVVVVVALGDELCSGLYKIGLRIDRHQKQGGKNTLEVNTVQVSKDDLSRT